MQSNGCTGCHGATWNGGIGPALYGIEHRRNALQIAAHIKHPTAPMPNFGFTDAQIDDIVAYLSNLDGGAQSGAPVVTFEPATPIQAATVRVHFSGTPPQNVSALPIMTMGKNTMQTSVVALHATPSDPLTFSGRVTFSMSGPWIVRIRYDDRSLDVPLNVGT